MLEEQRANNTPGRPNTSRRHLLWISGVWVLPLCWLLGWIFPSSVPHTSLVLLAACSLAEGDGLFLGPLRVDHHDLGHSLGQGQGRLQRFGEPATDVVAPHQAVDHHFDGR